MRSRSSTDTRSAIVRFIIFLYVSMAVHSVPMPAARYHFRKGVRPTELAPSPIPRRSACGTSPRHCAACTKSKLGQLLRCISKPVICVIAFLHAAAISCPTTFSCTTPPERTCGFSPEMRGAFPGSCPGTCFCAGGNTCGVCPGPSSPWPDAAKPVAAFPQVLLLRPAVSHSLASWCARSVFGGVHPGGTIRVPWQGLWTLGCLPLLTLPTRGALCALLYALE